jgi:MFS superfamily sulfate permease-like transporter
MKNKLTGWRVGTDVATAAIPQNLLSGFVVFLVALPLCIGIAAACGLTPDKGLISGAIGGIIVGLAGGAPLQVSGPANGLIPVVGELVTEHGVAVLGAAVMVAGLLQVIAGTLRAGVFFRAICPSVIHGLLAGFALVIFSGQLLIAFDASPKSTFALNMAALPSHVAQTIGSPAVQHAILVALSTFLFVLFWNRLGSLPRLAWLKKIPAYLAAIIAATGLHYLTGLVSRTIQLPESMAQDLMEGTGSVGYLLSLDGGEIAVVLEFAVIIALLASIETMVSTVSLDKISEGRGSRYNRELFAQGIGNFICGLFSAPPITGVIIRSSANLQAGATNRLSAIFHGILLLAAMFALASVLEFIPAAALAAVLIHAASRLVNVNAIRKLGAEERRHLMTFAATAITVVSFGVLYGVIVGLAISAWSLFRKFVRLEIELKESRVELRGTATFIDLPKLLRVLEKQPDDGAVLVCTEGLRYADPSVRDALDAWQKRVARGAGVTG